MRHKGEGFGCRRIDDVRRRDAEAAAQLGELVDERDVHQPEGVFEQLRRLSDLDPRYWMRFNSGRAVELARQSDRLLAKTADYARNLSEFGSASGVETLRHMDDPPAGFSDDRGEPLCEPDRHRACDDDQSASRRQLHVAAGENFERVHPDCAIRQQVREAEDKNVRIRELAEPVTDDRVLACAGTQGLHTLA